ncbi:hypothetical protein EGW08_003693 [Elysia chlorotica]|uniref:Elongation factor 1-beta n=1 Tax=Elysia chlorotica TaxID=188477 RepID=A0A3S1A1Z5_ELYCH|nr:hypothetical protein EGW08_003693 [Elysia chlorotica]
MGFGDLKSKAGLEALNAFLADRSYIEGYVPSQADNVVYGAVGKAPAASLAHALRWYNQMTSWQSKKDSLPGVKKPVASYGPSGGAAADDDDDDDLDDDDLFGSDDEDAKALREKRLAEYAAKKEKKPALIAKSNIILDVKPWEDTTDMKEMERLVRGIKADGLLWGASKLVPVGYGINKLQICCVVEDDKISTDFLEEEITAFEDHVQSMDIAAFNKI